MSKSQQVARQVLARNVRGLRRARGLSQESFAHASGLDRTYVSGIERGVRNPTLDVLARIADTLHISVSDLLRDEEAE